MLYRIPEGELRALAADRSISMADVARVCGITGPMVSVLCKRYGINWLRARRQERREPTVSPCPARELRNRAILCLRDNGFMLNDIGRFVGISRERVRQIEEKARLAKGREVEK
jgi:hypothetical protein